MENKEYQSWKASIGPSGSHLLGYTLACNLFLEDSFSYRANSNSADYISVLHLYVIPALCVVILDCIFWF
jgi:hypothetical protein